MCHCRQSARRGAWPSTGCTQLIHQVDQMQPVMPHLAARPTRCTNSLGCGGKSKLMTLSSSGMSMPRAATSVTTRNCARPARNLAMLILRAACVHSSQVRGCCKQSSTGQAGLVHLHVLTLRKACGCGAVQGKGQHHSASVQLLFLANADSKGALGLRGRDILRLNHLQHAGKMLQTGWVPHVTPVVGGDAPGLGLGVVERGLPDC